MTFAPVPWSTAGAAITLRQQRAENLLAELFAGGQAGVWYDPSDLGTLFQDSAGTTPVTATGQPVGRILDKSGRGNHAIQATSGSRPIYRDVGGFRYLEFDGVDDFLRATFTITQPIDRISAVKQISWTNADRIFCGGAAISSTLQQAGSSPFLVLYTGTANLVMDPSPAIDVAGVVTERHSGATSRIAFNNNAYDVADTGTLAPGGITIGARFDGASPGNFHLYQAIMRGGPTPMTDAQVAACRTRCAEKSGVYL
jgi:hypothetical protein